MIFAVICLKFYEYEEIDIKPFAEWEEVHNPLMGSILKSPTNLLIEVINNSHKNFQIDSICCSIKYILCEKDVLQKKEHHIIKPNSTIRLRLDIRYILDQYNINKKFTVKIISNNDVYESERISIKTLEVLR